MKERREKRLHYYIIQLTLHRGFSVTDYIKYYAYFCYLLSLIDLLYTLDSASNYSAIQKLKPWLQSQVVPMKWEDSYVFYFLNRELNSKYIFKPFKWWKLLLFLSVYWQVGTTNMAAIYSNGVTAGIFLASIVLREIRYLVYIRYLCLA
jgi:hypothetical protein